MSSEMYARVARLATFDRPLKQTKKRTSSQTKKKAVTWPHQTPVPDELARAGFFFEPDDSDGDDNVKCFSCRANLNGWESEDDPAKEHIAHRPDCSWAIAISVTYAAESRDPLSKVLLEARVDTFNHGPEQWPHEGQCDVQHMAEAGWSLDCGEGYEDGTTCHYCRLQLDGWEPEDDPWKEHQKREPDCRFFQLVEQHHGKTKPKKVKATRKRATSKASRASVQSTVSHAASELPDDLDDEIAGPDTRSPRSMKAKKTTKTKKQPEASQEDDEDKPAKKARKTTKKATKSNVATAEEPIEKSMREIVDEEVEVAPQAKKSKLSSASQSKPASKGAKSSMVSISDSIEIIPDEHLHSPAAKKQKTTKPKKTSQLKPRFSTADEQLQEELEASIMSPNFQVFGSSPDAPRALKRSSDGSVKSSASALVVEFPLPPQSKTARAAPAYMIDDEEQIEAELARIEAEQRQRENKSNPAPEHDFEILQDEIDAEQAPEAARTAYSTPNVSPSGSDKENTSSFVEDAVDKEAPVYMSPTKTTRIPLAPSTPNRLLQAKRPVTSPSKRMLGATRSTEPWIPTDIENVLLTCSAATPLRGQLISQAGTITSEERGMTVEAWIRSRAGKAEDELRRKGEEMVSGFEREGNRAIASLRGLAV